MKFLIIDDHALFRHGLVLLLKQLQGDNSFIEMESCEAALAAADRYGDVDLILLDLALPGMSGLEGLVRLKTLFPTTPVVLLSASENGQIIVEGMRRGAQGFIPKSCSPEVMSAALQVVLAGGTYMPALGVGELPSPEAAGDLTARQREVLQLLGRNMSNKEIAEVLGMRVNTVRVHVAAILRALDVDNRNEAVRAALGRGLMANGC